MSGGTRDTYTTWCLLVCVLALWACGSGRLPLPLPSPDSKPPAGSAPGLQAGFGRADITPPPGVPLSGNGFEGQQAVGYRHRLYARALVLEDSRGERLALLVTDLSHISLNVHRLTAERVARRVGIGADRLVLAVTHTHAAPGGHYAVRSYNDQAAAFNGYDPTMVDFLVERLSRAVLDAESDLSPAVAAWDTVVVPASAGLTRNRSFDAFLENPTPRLTRTNPRQAGEAAEEARDRQRREAVDRTWPMLRVDQCDPGWENCRPTGAFSVYAIHGTGNPAANDLVDGDIHALVERGIERHIETLNGALPSSDAKDCPPVEEEAESPIRHGEGCTFGSQAFHLFANGTEGDVSPNHDPGTRCGLEEDDKHVSGGDADLRFLAGRRPGGPRTPAPPEEWRLAPGQSLDGCLDRSRRSTNRIGDALVTYARTAFDRAGNRLSRQVTIDRASDTYDLQLPFGTPPACLEPRSGTANFGGAEDGRTRLFGWRFLFFWHSRITEGGPAIDTNKATCQGAKRNALGFVQRLVVGGGGLPRFAQLTVARIGEMLVGTMPAEVTTEAGMRMKQEMLRRGPDDVRHVALVGLANGYFQYVNTEEEYGLQSYEGGSNLYGPKSAGAFQAALGTLAESIAQDAPIARVGPAVATPGTERRLLYPRSNGPDPGQIPRRVDPPQCSNGDFKAGWIDAYPGALVPADGQVLEIQQRTSGGTWQPVAWDDDRGVEVRAVRPSGEGYLWEVTWRPPTPPSGEHRLVLTERQWAGSTVEALPGPGRPVPSVMCR